MNRNKRDLLNALKRISITKVNKTVSTVKEIKYNPKQENRIKIATEKFKTPIKTNKELLEVALTPENVVAEQYRANLESEIISGEYIRNRNKIYIDNYISFLKSLGVEQELINRLQELDPSPDNTIISDMLPKLGDYYYPLKRGYVVLKEKTDDNTTKISKSKVDIGQSISDIIKGVEEALDILEKTGV